MPSVSAPTTQLCKMYIELLMVSLVKYKAFLLPKIKAGRQAISVTQNQLFQQSLLHHEGAATPLKCQSCARRWPSISDLKFKLQLKIYGVLRFMGSQCRTRLSD